LGKGEEKVPPGANTIILASVKVSDRGEVREAYGKETEGLGRLPSNRNEAAEERPLDGFEWGSRTIREGW